MKQKEFRKEIKNLLHEKGFRKIRIKVHFFFNRAEIRARDRKGNQRLFKAYTERKHAKTTVIIKEVRDELSWIDELDMYSAIFDD